MQIAFIFRGCIVVSMFSECSVIFTPVTEWFSSVASCFIAKFKAVPLLAVLLLTVDDV